MFIVPKANVVVDFVDWIGTLDGIFVFLFCFFHRRETKKDFHFQV